MNTGIKKYLDNLPKTTGVYLFYEKSIDARPYPLDPIYIGKAINIKDRVKNHFFQPNYKDNLYIHRVSKIDFINTNSEIEALVLEAQLIKKHQPKFNSVWRDDKNYFYVVVANKKCPIVYIGHQRKDLKALYIGPFTEGNALKKTLKFLRKVFPYYTTNKHSDKKCTWCHLDLCPGPKPDFNAYKKNIKKLTLILQGKSKTALYALKKEMALASKQNKFEEALKIRDKITALEKIMAHTQVIENQNSEVKSQKLAEKKWQKTEKLLQEILEIKTPISKIECYDISNIGGALAVGSMAVFVNGAPNKSQYKKFRIKMENKPNDTAMLKEILTRRLMHPEWAYPEVMLIDGGISQLNVGIKSKNQNLPKPTAVDFGKYAKNIKIISIAKGKKELIIQGPATAKSMTGKAKKIPLNKLPQDIYNLITYLDDEAHRFAINYHRNLRKKYLLPKNAHS